MMLVKTALLVIAVAGVAGCAPKYYPMQAPFDSFVCFRSSFNDCMNKSQDGQLASYAATTHDARATTRQHQQAQLVTYTTARMPAPEHRYAVRIRNEMKLPAVGNKPPSEQAITSPDAPASLAAELDGVSLKDRDANVARTTQDKKYKCSYGSVPYTQKLDPKVTSDAVFVSPVLVKQIGEELVRLEQVRLACDRLIEQYDTDVQLIAAQDLLSKYQRAVAELSAYAENARIGREPQRHASAHGPSLGQDAIEADDAAAYGIEKGSSTADALWISRANVSDATDGVRNIQKTQTLDVDYAVKFDQVQIAIDLQARVLARMLFLLDRSVPPTDVYDHKTVDAKYMNGSWVKQGTVVFEARPK